MSETAEAFLTVPETAERLRLSRPSVYRLISGGVIPGVRLGGAIRVPADGLEDAIRANTLSTAAPVGNSHPVGAADPAEAV